MMERGGGERCGNGEKRERKGWGMGGYRLSNNVI